MTYQKSLRTALLHLQKARSQFDPETHGIPKGSNREAALISSLELAEIILEMRKGA